MHPFRLYLLACFLLLDISWASAQFSMGGYVSSTFGTQQFGQHLNGAYGVSFQGLYRFQNTAFSVGLDLGTSWYGHREFEATLADIGTEGALATAEESLGFYNYALLARVDLTPPSVWNPYLEGRVGGMSFFRQTYYENLSPINADDELGSAFHCPTDMDALGTAFQAGLGAGLTLDLSRVGQNWKCFPIHLDLNVLYQVGTAADYMARPRISSPRIPGQSDVGNAAGAPSASVSEVPVRTRTLTNNVAVRLGAYLFFQR